MGSGAWNGTYWVPPVCIVRKMINFALGLIGFVKIEATNFILS